MAIASSLSSSKSLLERFRSPVFIASALSLGAHGVFFAAMPILSASEDLQEQEESVPVVALSAEESQRLPDAVRGDRSDPFAIFGEAPLATQDGDLSLPVPGSPPFGDLSGLDDLSSSLPTNTSPLWGNPVDIFQGSLPAIPGDTSVIFPPTSGFDSLGDQAFEISVGGNTSAGSPFDSSETTAGDASGNAPAVQPEDDNTASETLEPGDAPLFDRNDEEELGSGLEASSVAPEGGTTIGNAFTGESEAESEQGQEPDPVDPDNLARSQPADGDEGDVQSSDGSPADASPEGDAPALDSQDPMMIAFREKQELYRGYTKQQGDFSDAAEVQSSIGDAVSEQEQKQELALKPVQRLVIQYPDPDFRCPADAAPAVFALAITPDVSNATPQLKQSTQYPALDAAATEAAVTYAGGLTEPGVYSLEIKFQDKAGSCVASEPIS